MIELGETIEKMLTDPEEMAREFPDLLPCERPKLRKEFWWVAEYTNAPLQKAADSI